MERICQFEKGHLLPYVEEQCQDVLGAYRTIGLDPMAEPKTAVSIIGTGEPFCNYYGRMTLLLDLTETRMNSCDAKELENQLFVDVTHIEPYLQKGLDLEDWERSWPYLKFPLSELEMDHLKIALGLQVEKHINMFDNGTFEAHPEEIEISSRKIERLNHIFEKQFTALSGITENLTINGVLRKERTCEFTNEHLIPYVEQYCQDVLSQYRIIGLDPMVEPRTARSAFFCQEIPFYSYYNRMNDLLCLTGSRIYLESPNVYKSSHESIEKFLETYRKDEAKYLESLQSDIEKIKPYAKQGFDFVNWERYCPYLEFPLPEDELQDVKKYLRELFAEMLHGLSGKMDKNILGDPECVEIIFRDIDRANYILELHYLAQKERR